MVYEMMHDLDLEIKHTGRDNIGGTVLNDRVVEYHEDAAEIRFRSLIHVADLETEPGHWSILLSLGELKELIADWSSHDYHSHDPICNTDASPILPR
jgi:hypothetical protein